MTTEKLKRQFFSSRLAYGRKMSRRESRKLIRQERANTKRLIQKKQITRKTRFVCNWCGAALRFHDWIFEAGMVIRCPKCQKEIMDICYAERIEI